MRKVALLALLAVSSVAAHAQLFNNSTANGVGTPIGIETNTPGPTGAGSWFSRLQGAQSTFGFSANPTFRLADDFTVTGGGWSVSTVRTFGYNTNATTPTITGGSAEIRSGSVTGSTVGTLTFAGSVFTDVYRVTATATDSARRVQQVTWNYSGANLGAGSYWLTWNYTLTGAGATIFVPPLTVAGSSAQLAGANAQQFNSTWAPAVMGGTNTNVELPFIINGQAVPEPATMIALGLGAAALIRRRRK